MVRKNTKNKQIDVNNLSLLTKKCKNKMKKKKTPFASWLLIVEKNPLNYSL